MDIGFSCNIEGRGGHNFVRLSLRVGDTVPGEGWETLGLTAAALQEAPANPDALHADPRTTPPRDIRPAQAEAYVFTRHNILPCGSSAFDGDRLYFRLNNRLEHDVGQIERARRHHLNRHYGLISRLCIRISNREAAGYLLIGFALCALFGFTFAWLTLAGRRDPGHIYAVVSYLWSFAMSIDDAPHLPEEFYKIKDIGKRVHVEDA